MLENIKSNQIGPLVRYARSFYQLLGNRRKFERLPISEEITLTARGLAVDVTHVCRGVDISPLGIGVDSPEAIAPNTYLHVRVENGDDGRLATVRYCEQRGSTFRVGLEFMVDARHSDSR